MSNIKNQFSRRKIKISKELLNALENAQLPDDVIEYIISILLSAQEARRRKKEEASSKDIVTYPNPAISPQEMLHNTYNRLDGLIERTEELKSRVDTINLELQKLSYFGQ